MSEPVWVPLQAVLIIHDRQIARHGGAQPVDKMASDTGLETSMMNQKTDPGNQRK